jgi:hypothetical protein
MRGLNSEIIVGSALIFLSILFLYAAAASGGYWAAIVSIGVCYVLIALGIGFIVHGFWTRRNLAREGRVEAPHH